MIIKGKDILICEDDGEDVVGMSRSHELNINCDEIEVTPESSSDWRHVIAGMKEWSLSINHFVTDMKTDAMKIGQTYEIYTLDRRTSPATLTFMGYVLCKEVKVSDSVGALTKGSFTFKGNGPIYPNG